jgi:hypothetical protein
LNVLAAAGVESCDHRLDGNQQLHAAQIRRLICTRPMTSEQLLDLLDRIYDLGAGEFDWLRGIAETVRPLVD